MLANRIFPPNGVKDPDFDGASSVIIPLPSDLDAPSASRHFLVENTPGWPADLVDDAILLVSELVTNAVTYAGRRSPSRCASVPRSSESRWVMRVPNLRWLSYRRSIPMTRTGGG